MSNIEQEPKLHVPEVYARKNVLSNALWFLGQAVPDVLITPHLDTSVSYIDEYRRTKPSPATQESVNASHDEPFSNITDLNDKRKVRALEAQAKDAANSARDIILKPAI